MGQQDSTRKKVDLGAVLVVEDDPVLALNLEATLTDRGARQVTISPTTQDALEARYDRALAAGYKALFLCSAIANAERNGASRTAESVFEWELSGIQAPLGPLADTMPYRIARGADGTKLGVPPSWQH